MATETRIYDLGIHYGLKPENGAKKVKDIYPKAGTERAALPWAWKASTGKLLGLDTNAFRELHIFSAVLLDATFRQEADGNMATGFLNTYNRVIVPPGKYWTNANIPTPRGGIDGAGSFYYYGSGGDQGYAATEIAMAKDYLGNPAEMYALATPNFNLIHTDNFFAYNESYRISGLCITNDNALGAKQRIGLMLTAPGEVSALDNIRAKGFDIGICIEAPTPFTGGDVSVFSNRVAGVATRGGALSTASMRTISGDRNGSLFRQLPGLGGQPAGGSFTFSVGKAEDANQEGQGAYGDQVVAWCSGQFVVRVDNCRPTCESRINDAAFVVYPYIKQGQRQNSLLKATGMGHRYNTLLHDIGTGQRIAWPGDFKAFDFTYASEDNSFFTPLPGGWTWEQAGSAVLGSVDRDPMTGRPMGGWDYLSRTPSRGDDRDDGFYGSSPARGVVKRPVDMDALRAEIRAMVDAAIGGTPADDAALRDAATRARDLLDGAL